MHAAGGDGVSHFLQQVDRNQTLPYSGCQFGTGLDGIDERKRQRASAKVRQGGRQHAARIRNTDSAGRCAHALTEHRSRGRVAYHHIQRDGDNARTTSHAIGAAPPDAFAAAALPCVMFTEGGPSGHGGLGLRSAVRHALAACWASWVDCLQLFARCELAFDECLSASLAGHDLLPLALNPACSASPGQQC